MQAAGAAGRIGDWSGQWGEGLPASNAKQSQFGGNGCIFNTLEGRREAVFVGSEAMTEASGQLHVNPGMDGIH
jgi:hypothetical protein